MFAGTKSIHIFRLYNGQINTRTRFGQTPRACVRISLRRAPNPAYRCCAPMNIQNRVACASDSSSPETGLRVHTCSAHVADKPVTENAVTTSWREPTAAFFAHHLAPPRSDRVFAANRTRLSIGPNAPRIITRIFTRHLTETIRIRVNNYAKNTCRFVCDRNDVSRW